MHRPGSSVLLRFLGAAIFPWRVLAFVGCLAGAACGGDGQPPANTEGADVDSGEQAKLERSKRKITEANRAYAAKQYDKARKFLQEASALGVDSHRYEITELSDKLDKRQAKLYANDAQDKLDKKDCTGALKDLGRSLDAMKSESFARELRRSAAGPAVKCLQAVMDEATLAARYSEARKLVAADETKKVLGPEAWKKLSDELEGTIAEALKSLVAEDLKARRWQAAVEKLDQAVKRGDAEETQATAVLATIREAASGEISALAVKGVGQRDGANVLRQLDALIKTVRWEVLDGDVGALQKDKALPDELRQKREVLAVWVETQRAAMKPLKKPEKRWTYGKVPVQPAGKIDGESKRDLPGGAEVWVLGLTKDKALVSDSDPGGGSLSSQLAKAVGWAPLGRLAKESTSDWLPPEDQLKGTRVWGPLRSADLLELGTVSEVAGQDVSVKRLADDAVVKVPRRALRNGRLGPGTKVLTFCTSKDQPAQVVEILPASRGVKLKCDGGQEKEEQLAGLRTKLELLPSTKEPK
jgi:hypothetical protein